MKYNRKHSQDKIIQAIKDSKSIREVLLKLNLNATGGNYRSTYKFISEYQLDTSHFLGQASNKGKIFPPKRPIQDYLSNKYSISSHSLRLRLIREGLKKYECESCKLSEWQGMPIPLELDHINGIHEDNTLSNLRILCSNCHALTPTHRGGNVGISNGNPVWKRDKSLKVVVIKTKLCLCGKNITEQATSCVQCAHEKLHRIIWPSKEELEKLVWEKPKSSLAKELGVSDVAISKRCKKLGIKEPGRGYWLKNQSHLVS